MQPYSQLQPWRKDQTMLDLLQNEYRHHFDNIVILCPTLRCYILSKSRPWIWSTCITYF